ncbi:Nucleotidylyl transferase [Meira miltonrushii]|uniref:Nucleotidylyl transferase n=1 Tax=Meira miltonrushii TaxID=1280837 RepID=A0A316VFR2_9BASI|nr:Nucleotidylyl transferase [Meira miltonrushii]PWN36370.1 Nucleotidylyl transferase [Meira miltonrushii]
MNVGEISAQIGSYLKLSSNPKPLRLIYSSTPTWPFPETKSSSHQQQIDIGVLDSSFNPPHKAHHALATSSKPAFADEQATAIKGKEQYDAILLLFSVRNADKGLGSSKDASPAQRIEMMQLMAQELESEKSMNVAVGIVEEPLMITKSTLIHDFIKQQPSTAPIRLHWLVGFDTLERFFQVKYYPSPDYFAKACQTFFEDERTTFVCARRQMNKNTDAGRDTSSQKAEQVLLQSKEVSPWKERGSVVMIDLPTSVQDVSSTAIRRTIQKKDSKSDEDLQGKLSQMTASSIASYLVREKLYKE